MDSKYLRNREYQKMKEQQSATEGDGKNKKKDEVYVYNPTDYTFENVIRIFITKMNGGM